jgi:Glycosyl transferases group 1
VRQNENLQFRFWKRSAMIPPRVLIVGDFCRSSFGSQYYKTNFALLNGFTRAGCNVLTFSDRDTARESALLPHKALGKSSMNRALIEHAKAYEPHLVLFGHVDMCDGATFEAVRASVPGVVLAQFHVDALFRERAMARFRERGQHMHISFITTADRDRLATVAAHKDSVAFFPNPVDGSIATANIAECPSSEVPYDGVFLGNGDVRREAQVTELMTALPDHFRFFAGGKIFGTPRLHGPQFLRTLASGTMSPNLPLDEIRPVDFLYSSSRIAQLLVQGVVPLCPASAGLDQLYEDGIVAYSSIADLAEKMAALQADDDRRRRIAAAGWRIGRERTGAERVARYMLDMTLGDGPSCDYGWPTDRV